MTGDDVDDAALRRLLAKVIGTQNERDLKRLRPIVGDVNAFEAGLQPLSDDQLRAKTAGK